MGLQAENERGGERARDESDLSDNLGMTLLR